MRISEIKQILLEGLTRQQKTAVESDRRRVLVIAGAGSGKTDVMSRKVAWWIGVDRVPKENVVAFTFTEAAAEELKFRVRKYVSLITDADRDSTLNGMYIGTIHGFCLKVLREHAPRMYYNFDIVDEAGRISLIQRGYNGLLGLRAFQSALGLGQFEATDRFLRAYDLLNEYDVLDVRLGPGEAPSDVAQERDWVRQAVLRTNVGRSDVSRTFSISAARFYAYMRARRLLDFSTSQTELTRLLRDEPRARRDVRRRFTHIVLDEIQDINPVQDSLVREIVGRQGKLTAVGDHRQSIYAFRGSRVELMERINSELRRAQDSDVIELPDNFRSTDRIISIANEWSRTLTPLGSLSNPDMERGNQRRIDYSPTHVAMKGFGERGLEATWIARTINKLVHPEQGEGARHDNRDANRGLSFSDVALLLRSSTDVRTYQEALRTHGIPVVVKAGPGLFSQPEVLLFISLLAICGGVDTFFGNPEDSRTLAGKILNVLGCDPDPESVVVASVNALRSSGLAIPAGTSRRLIKLARAIGKRITIGGPPDENISNLKSTEAKTWVTRNSIPRRVFPQQILHWLFEEAAIHDFDTENELLQTVMFHLGQLSRLLTSVEIPGWTQASDLKYQVIALANWGNGNARSEEAPLLVQPDAVTVTTIHSAKGLEFPVVFLADVNARRFPNSRARTREDLPFQGSILETIDIDALSDNDNLDNERRLMYVAVTRAQRYLFITHSGRQQSRFVHQLADIFRNAGASIDQDEAPSSLQYYRTERDANVRLSTSFSDLRYFLECSHDFYLRKVLGFAPTIDQAFGYGRGVHNVLREIHSNPRYWARLAANPERLQDEVTRLVRSGLFYLRYTTSDPLENMRNTAIRGITQYVHTYAGELTNLDFEPEKEFETLIPDEDLLISGTIDLLRMDDPPRVTIVDFKSGERGEANQSNLNEELMKMQIGIYGIAARHELEYQPNEGLIRYVGEQNETRRELPVSLSDEQLQITRETIIQNAREIKERSFHRGPTVSNLDRCSTCDFLKICGMGDARTTRDRG